VCAGLGCGDDPAGPATGGAPATVSCITGGAPRPSSLVLAAAELNALADLAVTSGGETLSARASCSAVLVGDEWLLTAAHCTRDPASTRVTARFGPRAACGDDGRRAVASAEVYTHAQLDLMLVRLAEAPARVGIDVAPIRPQPDEALRPGEIVELAGFGRTEDSLPGQLRFVAEPVSAVAPEWIDVDGQGRSGACVADSGGPLLVRDAGGAVRSAGVLSEGSASCVGVDRYVRVRAALDWLSSLGV
jgi:hypothetical protein